MANICLHDPKQVQEERIDYKFLLYSSAIHNPTALQQKDVSGLITENQGIFPSYGF